MKLCAFQSYYNGYRAHAALKGCPPERILDAGGIHARLHSYSWQRHCRRLYQTPLAACGVRDGRTTEDGFAGGCGERVSHSDLEFARDRQRNASRPRSTEIEFGLTGRIPPRRYQIDAAALLVPA